MRNPLKVIISALQTWTNKRIKSNTFRLGDEKEKMNKKSNTF